MEYFDIDDYEAVLLLRDLLGDSVSTKRDPTNQNTVYVGLDPKLDGFRSVTEGIKDSKSEGVSFSTPQGPLHVVGSRSLTCRHTTLHIEEEDASLIQHAWTHWNTNFSISALNRTDTAGLADRMILGICTDTLRLLLSLNDFVTGPITFSTGNDRSKCVALVKQAQLSLERPMSALMMILRYEQYWSLETAQKRQRTRIFAEAAGGLRCIAVVFKRSPLYEELSREYGPVRLPVNILLSVAAWMETVGSHPFSAGPRYSAVTNADDTTTLGSRLEPQRPPSAENGSTAPEEQLSAQATLSEANICPLPWHTARLIYKLQNVYHVPNTPFTINNPDPPKHSSPFTSLPPAIAGRSSLPPTPLSLFLRHLNPRFLPPTLQNLYFTHLHPFFTTVTSQLNVLTTTSTLDSAISPTGHPEFTALNLLTATLLNHLRRIFFPTLGQSLYRADPLNDLRLAISNPDVFVREMLGGDTSGRWPSWGWLAWQRWAAMAAWEVVCLGILPSRGWDGDGDGKRGRQGRIDAVARVARLVWLLGAVEDGFARGMDVAAWLVAGYGLLGGGEVGRVALKMAVEGYWSRAAIALWQLGWYLKNGVRPLVWVSLLCAGRGQPGLLAAVCGVVGGVLVVLKYRSTFYIALEISGMFVCLGFVLIGLMVLGLEAFDDPLGLNRSSRIAKARGDRARRLLSHQPNVTMERMERKVLVPVRLGKPVMEKCFKEKDS